MSEDHSSAADVASDAAPEQDHNPEPENDPWYGALVGERPHRWLGRRHDKCPKKLSGYLNRDNRARWVRGLPPDGWMPASIADRWESILYPQSATPESVAAWILAMDTLDRSAAQGGAGEVAGRFRGMLERDLELLLAFDESLHDAAIARLRCENQNSGADVSETCQAQTAPPVVETSPPLPMDPLDVSSISGGRRRPFLEKLNTHSRVHIDEVSVAVYEQSYKNCMSAMDKLIKNTNAWLAEHKRNLEIQRAGSTLQLTPVTPPSGQK